MKIKFRLTVFSMLWVALPLLSCACPTTTYAFSSESHLIQNVDNPSESLIVLTKSEIQSFDAALARLEKLSTNTLIIEGYPFKKTLADDEIPSLPAHGDNFSKTLSTLASAYDYDVKRRKGVYILRKRFSQAEDLPAVTFEQLTACISSLRQSVDAFNPKFHGMSALDPFRTELLPTITSEQWDKMTSEGGIPVNQLPQQALLRKIALFYLVQKRLSGLDDVETIANRIELDGTLFKRDSVQGATYFGYDFLIKKDPPHADKRQFMVLNNASGKVSRYNVFRAKQDGSASLGLSIKSDPDKSAVTVVSDSNKETRTYKKLTTIGDVCKALNAREGESAQNRKRFKVASELATLPLTVTNLASTDSEAIWDAIASMYGTSVTEATSKEEGANAEVTVFQMSPPTIKPAKEISDLQITLTSVLPETFLRSCSQESSAERAEQRNIAVAQKQTTFTAPHSRRIVELRIAAMKQLRTLVEPRLEAQHNKGLTLSEIGEPARQALAVFLLTGALDPTNGVSALIYGDMPEYIERFEECVVTGGSYEQDGKKLKKLIMGINDPRMKDGVRPVLGAYDIEDKQDQTETDKN